MACRDGAAAAPEEVVQSGSEIKRDDDDEDDLEAGPLDGPARKRARQDDGAQDLDDMAGNLIPQHDGPADNGDDGGDDGDAPPADDEELSSDEEDDEEEEHVDNFLCCQFEKVNRTKNRWKINMKEGVFHINGKDYLFKKANGEWIF